MHMHTTRKFHFEVEFLDYLHGNANRLKRWESFFAYHFFELSEFLLEAGLVALASAFAALYQLVNQVAQTLLQID